MIAPCDNLDSSSSAVLPTLAARIVLLVPTERDRQTLCEWLNLTENERFFGPCQKSLSFLDSPPPGAGHRAVLIDGALVGYLRWRPLNRDELAHTSLPSLLPANALQLECLIGDVAQRGLGIGSQAIRILRRILSETVGERALIALGCVHHLSYRRAFEKAGLRSHFFYDDPVRGPMVAMVRFPSAPSQPGQPPSR